MINIDDQRVEGDERDYRLMLAIEKCKGRSGDTAVSHIREYIIFCLEMDPYSVESCY